MVDYILELAEVTDKPVALEELFSEEDEDEARSRAADEARAGAVRQERCGAR